MEATNDVTMGRSWERRGTVVPLGEVIRSAKAMRHGRFKDYPKARFVPTDMLTSDLPVCSEIAEHLTLRKTRLRSE